MGRSLQVKSELVKQVKAAVTRNGYPSQQALAGALGLSRDVISRFLNGKPIDYLNAEEICRVLNLDLGEMTGYGQPVTEQPKRRVDWGNAVDTLQEDERNEAIQEIEKWIIQDNSRLVLIGGMKGMAKTNLSFRLGKKIQDNFDFIFWRSLDQYLSIDDLLQDLCKFFKGDCSNNDNQINSLQIEKQLKVHLKEYRCLLILTNINVILDENRNILTQYKDYKLLLEWFLREQEKSCVVITSDVYPNEIISLQTIQPQFVRCYNVEGLSIQSIQNIFHTFGHFIGTEQDWKYLKETYEGNAFVLKNIAVNIQASFDGNITQFVNYIKDQENCVFNSIEEFLDREVFSHLPEVERGIMYWLAIYRHPINIFELKYIVPDLFDDQLLVIVQHLKQRYLIEGEGDGFISQTPMIRDYFLKNLVNEISQEVITNNPYLIIRFPLLIAISKAKVRKDQEKFLLQPIISQLRSNLGPRNANRSLNNLLAHAHKGYLAGNIINLLRHLEDYKLDRQEFSGLTIKNADFRAINLQNTDFSQSDFSNCIFQDAFSNVLSVAFSPDGQYLAVGDNHAQVYIWRVTENRPILHHIITGDNDWVRAVAFSPDSQWLASGGDSNVIYLREVHTGKLITSFEGHIDRIRSLSFSPNGKYLASSGDDWTIRIWDLERLQLVTVLSQHQNKVITVIFSCNGQLISASQDNWICIWQVGSFECVKKFSLSETSFLLRTVAISPDGQILATGSDDHIVRLWTLEGEFIKDFPGHNHWLYSLAFSPDGSQLASASEDTTIRIWDVKTSECLHLLKQHKARIWSIAYHPNRPWLVAGDDRQNVRLWQTETGECLGRFAGYSQKIDPLAFHPNGQILATGSNQFMIDLRDVLTGEESDSLPTNGGNILSLAYDPKGEILVAGSEDHSIKIWDCFALENPPKSLQGHYNWVRTVAISADGQFIASGSDDKTVKLWDSRTYLYLHTFHGHYNWIRSVCFDPKGQFLASGSDDGMIKLWDINKPYELKKMLRHNPQEASERESQVWAITISPDGKILASGSNDNTITIWNLETYEPLNLHQHRKWIAALAFSPDGKWLASASYDTTIRLWELASGRYECQHILQGHAKAVTAIAFHPTEPILASSSKDGSIKQWDLNRFDCIATWKSSRPYENMNITGVTGLNAAQKQSLKQLGAIEHRSTR
jgi:WD40 repeat protein/transcriptional regulator with XRE-family HTH domain